MELKGVDSPYDQIPDGWQVLTIGQVAAERKNAIVGGPFGSDLVSKDYVSAGVPVVRGQNMGGRWVSGDFAFVTEDKARELSANTARPRDLVITQRGTLGQVSLVPEGEHEKYVVSQSQMKATVDSGIARPDFCYHLLTSVPLQGYIQRSTIQTGVPHINLGILRQIPLLLPPLPEQDRITEALDDLGRLLTNLDDLIEKKRGLKTGAMQRLLTGGQRLPGFSGEWETKPLGDLFSFKNGLNKAKRFFGRGTPIVNYMDVYQASRLLASDLSGRVTVDRQEREAYGARKGDVFFTRTSETQGEIGIAAVMADDPVDTVFSGFVLRGRPVKNELVDVFKAYCFSTHEVREQIVASSTYTTRALTNGRNLSKVALRYPAKPEQEAIAAVLMDMDANIVALEARRAKAAQVRQGMTHELLTGHTRLV